MGLGFGSLGFLIKIIYRCRECVAFLPFSSALGYLNERKNYFIVSYENISIVWASLKWYQTEFTELWLCKTCRHVIAESVDMSMLALTG